MARPRIAPAVTVKLIAKDKGNPAGKLAGWTALKGQGDRDTPRFG